MAIIEEYSPMQCRVLDLPGLLLALGSLVAQMQGWSRMQPSQSYIRVRFHSYARKKTYPLCRQQNNAVSVVIITYNTQDILSKV
jgi:hypothetical protein